MNVDRLAWLRTSWCTLLKRVMDNDVWDEILQLPSRISICNRYKELQYKILHNIYISLYIYKYKAGISPNCPSCNRLHCLWECNKIQLFWRAICVNISTAIGQQVSANPLLCLLGNVLDSFIQSLRKAIMVKWVRDDSPSTYMWKSLITKVVTLEKIEHYIDGRTDLFLQKLKKTLESLGVKYNLDFKWITTLDKCLTWGQYTIYTNYHSIWLHCFSYYVSAVPQFSFFIYGPAL